MKKFYSFFCVLLIGCGSKQIPPSPTPTVVPTMTPTVTTKAMEQPKVLAKLSVPKLKTDITYVPIIVVPLPPRFAIEGNCDKLNPWVPEFFVTNFGGAALDNWIDYYRFRVGEEVSPEAKYLVYHSTFHMNASSRARIGNFMYDWSNPHYTLRVLYNPTGQDISYTVDCSVGIPTPTPVGTPIPWRTPVCGPGYDYKFNVNSWLTGCRPINEPTPVVPSTTPIPCVSVPGPGGFTNCATPTPTPNMTFTATPVVTPTVTPTPCMTFNGGAMVRC